MTNFVEQFTDEYNFIRHRENIDFGSTRHHKYLQSSNMDGDALSIKPNVTFINLRRIQDIPLRFLELTNLKKLQKQCNQLHKQIRRSIQHENDDDEVMDADFESESANGR